MYICIYLSIHLSIGGISVDKLTRIKDHVSMSDAYLQLYQEVYKELVKNGGIRVEKDVYLLQKLRKITSQMEAKDVIKDYDD
jgi:hypothetical protein